VAVAVRRAQASHMALTLAAKAAGHGHWWIVPALLRVAELADAATFDKFSRKLAGLQTQDDPAEAGPPWSS